jgi:hypothetical protein
LDEFSDALHAWGRLDKGTVKLQFIIEVLGIGAGREKLVQSFLVVRMKQLLVRFYQR